MTSALGILTPSPSRVWSPPLFPLSSVLPVHSRPAVWYGGAQRPLSPINAYWSCALVRIKGGAGPTKRFARRFEPGNPAPGERFIGGTAAQRKSKCVSSWNRLDVCAVRGCRPGKRRKVRWHVPFEFRNGKVPAPLKKEMYQ